VPPTCPTPPPIPHTGALINYADPPDAVTSNPLAYVRVQDEIGLNNRNYRDYPAAASRPAATAANASSPAGRRRLAGTAFGAPPPRAGARGGGAASSGAGGGGAAVNVQTGDGTARPIGGGVLGFDGIGAPETNTIPMDLGIAVGVTAAVHTANGLIRFYRVDPAGKKAADDSTFLKQVWMQDFFYAVGRRCLREGQRQGRLVRGEQL
jgi:hypothetical protein